MEYILIIFALIGMAGLLAQWFSWRVQVPSIFALLLAGILLGPVLGWVEPSLIFGKLLYPIITLAVAIILFEGSLTLVSKEIIGLRSLILRLVTLGLFLNWALSALVIYYVAGLDKYLAITLAAILSISGPTVITPLLNALNLRAHLKHILHWESVSIDALGAALALVIFLYSSSAITLDSSHFNMLQFFKHLLQGLVIGWLIGYLLARLVRSDLLPSTLVNLFTLVSVIVAYTIGAYTAESIGLISVATMGITMANMRNVRVKRILNFKENLSLVLISGVFILLAAQIELSNLKPLIVPAMILFAILQFIIRPLVVMVCTLGSSLTWRERFFLGWVFPRGIVGAAIAAIFAAKLDLLGAENSHELVLYTFLIIIMSVAWQTLTAKPLAKLLGLMKDTSTEVLIVGSNTLARDLAKCLMTLDFDVLMVDSDWEGIRTAKRQRISTLFGKVIQLQAREEIELREYDAIFLLPTRVEKSYALQAAMQLRIEKTAILPLCRFGEMLADAQDPVDIDMNKASIQSVTLTKEPSVNQYMAENPGLIPIALIRKQKNGRVIIGDFNLAQSGDKLLSART